MTIKCYGKKQTKAESGGSADGIGWTGKGLSEKVKGKQRPE